MHSIVVYNKNIAVDVQHGSLDTMSRRRKGGHDCNDTGADSRTSMSADDSRCDCCSVLTHQQSHIKTAANS